MSIQLDWDVSEAPRDDELAPQHLSTNLQRVHAHGSGSPNEPPAPTRRTTRPSRRVWLAGLAILLAIAGGGLWYYMQAGWQRVSRSVQAAVAYEDQQASQGAIDLLLNVQDIGNLDWLAVRRDEAQAKQPAPLPLPTLNFDAEPPKVAGLTALDTEFMLATVSRQFTTPGGQVLLFNLPQFYRRDASGAWLRSAPPGSFWGNWLDWHGAKLDIRYSERDADFVAQAASVLDQRLADACAAWAGGCPTQTPIRLYLSGFVGSLEYNPLANIEVRVEVSTTSGEAPAPSDYFLSVPSPQIAGVPANDAGRSYLTDYLAVRLIAELARQISTSPDGYAQRTSQAIQALGLTNADPGYISSGQRRHGPPVGAFLWSQGNMPLNPQDGAISVWTTP